MHFRISTRQTYTFYLLASCFARARKLIFVVCAPLALVLLLRCLAKALLSLLWSLLLLFLLLHNLRSRWLGNPSGPLLLFNVLMPPGLLADTDYCAFSMKIVCFFLKIHVTWYFIHHVCEAELPYWSSYDSCGAANSLQTCASRLPHTYTYIYNLLFLFARDFQNAV